MKALTIRQPHISQILAGTKAEEYRSWPCHYRGYVLLHAASQVDAGAAEDATLGAIVGVCRIAGCRTVEYSEDATYRERASFAWTLADVRAIDPPVPCKGALSLWDAPTDALDDVIVSLAGGRQMRLVES